MTSRLLSINNYHYPRGGAEIVFLRHNVMLESEGWSVARFCMQHERNLPSDWDDEFVEEIELGSPRDGLTDKLRKGLKAVYSLEARQRVAQLIDRFAPNICHAHNIYHHISPSILSAIRDRGVPLVMTLHDLKLACPAYSMLTHDGVCERCRGGRLFEVALNRCMKGRVSLSLLVMLESYLHRALGSYTHNVDRFIVPSRFYERKLVDWGFDGSRIEHVPNFVDAQSLEPELRPGGRFVYFGRLSREKGLPTLIDAAAEAGVKLDFVGTGPLETTLRETAARRNVDVRFLGFRSGEALHSVIRSARAVVVPSEWYENAPLSVLEAFALGKPVIAADIGGLPEQVIDGETGWIFESGSRDELAARLALVAGLSETAVADVGRAARARVVAEFSPARYLAHLRRIYTELGVSWH